MIIKIGEGKSERWNNKEGRKRFKVEEETRLLRIIDG